MVSTRRRSGYVERLAQVVLTILLLVCLVLLLRGLGMVFGPVLISLLLAYVLDNLITWVAGKGVSRTVAVLLIAGSALVLIAGFALLVVPLLISELSTALTDLPARVRAAIEEGQVFLVDRLGIAPEQLEQTLGTIAEHAKRSLLAAGGAAAESMASLFNLVLVPVFTFFFLRDWDRIVALPLQFVPKRYHEGVTVRAKAMDKAVGGWVRGQIKVALVLAVLLAIGLTVVGLRLGFAIGLLAGLLNVVPYLGAAIGIFLALVMVVVEQGTWVDVALVLGVFGVVQLFETYLITPKLIGDEVGMSPLTVLIVLLVGGTLFGFAGVLLAIPAAAIGAVVARDLLEVYQRTDFWQGASHDGVVGAVMGSASVGGAAAAPPLESAPADQAAPDAGPAAEAEDESQDPE